MWGSPSPVFYRCKLSWRLQTIHLFHKTREIMRASEGYWQLPSSPIVRKKHRDFLCKFKSVLIFMRIAKPFILPLQMFASITILLVHKTREIIAATEGHWRLPSSPIVRKKHKDFLCKFKSVLIYRRIAKPFISPLQMFGSTKWRTKSGHIL